MIDAGLVAKKLAMIETYVRELFTLLVRGGVLPEGLADRLGAMAGFRNVLVHGYGDLDLAVVEDIVENRTGDLLDFVREVRQRTS